MSTAYVFFIPDIMCSSCVGTVNDRLKPTVITSSAQPITIEKAYANELTKQVTVIIKENDVPVDVVMKAINAQLPDGLQCTAQVLPSNTRARFLFGLIGVLGGLALLILPFVMTGLPMLPIAIISTIVTFVLGASSYKKAASIFFNNGGLHMDTLFAVSTLTAIGVSIAAFFVPGLPMMFEAGLLIFGFRHIGEAIRSSLENKMGFKRRSQDRAPNAVKKVVNGSLVETFSSDLLPGDVIELEAGMMLPVDGIYSRGIGQIDVSSENGEDVLSANIVPSLRAGMTIVEGCIRMTVTQPVASSSLALADEQLTNSLNHQDKSSWEVKAERYLRYFIPGVFLLSMVSGVTIGLLFSPSLAIVCAVSVLVSACPCTLGLVTGMAVYVGMKKASDAGMLFTSTEKLESAHETDCVVWDLNGTLTTLTPEISSVIVESDCDEAQLLSYFLSIEAFSKKSIANCICEYARNKSAYDGLSLTQEQLNTTDHHGITATTVDGVVYHIGNAQMMENQGIAFKKQAVQFDETAIYLARERCVLGCIIVRRPLRAEAIDVVSALEKMGKRNFIFSGTDKDTVKAYAKVLNIPEDNLQWGCTPESKVEYIKNLQNQGHIVTMIGDADNDVKAIDAANFGVAMPVDGKPCNMSQQKAQAIFKHKSLEPILAAFEISSQTAKTIRQNLQFSIGYNVVASLVSGGILLPLGIVLNAGVGVFLMMIQTCGILLNTYALKTQQVLARMNNTYQTNSYDLMKCLGLSQKMSLINTDSSKPASHLPLFTQLSSSVKSSEIELIRYTQNVPY